MSRHARSALGPEDPLSIPRETDERIDEAPNFFANYTKVLD